MNNTEKKHVPNTDEIDLLAILKTLKSNTLTIAAFTIAATLSAGVYCWLASPIYQANATLQYDKINQASLLEKMNDGMLFGGNNGQIDSEIEVIKSRMVLGKTVSDLNLDIQILPSKIFSKFLSDAVIVHIAEYQLPPDLIGQPATLTFLDSCQYTLELAGQTYHGQIGIPLKQDEIHLLIDSCTAQGGEKLTLIKNDRYSAIENLRRRLSMNEASKSSGIINLTIKGTNQRENIEILDNVIQNYINQNREHRKLATNNTLIFLDNYIPKIKNKLDHYENQLNTFRKQNESIDLTLEAKSALESALHVEERLNELTFKEVELQQRYTRSHPAYQALLDTRQKLLLEKEKASKNIQQLPNTQQQIIRLTRDVESEQAIYNQLVTKQRELSVLNSGITADVRIIDSAESYPMAIAPKKSLIMVLASLLGLVMGCAFVIGKEILNNKIKNTEELEALGLRVYATVPFSLDEKKSRYRESKKPLSIENPADMAIESIRSLRTSVYFSVMNQDNNIVMVTSASPNVGKSFITANMAVVLANAGKKILLIDTDLRKGHIHKTFGLENKSGLSEFLSQHGGNSISKHQQVIENLDIISRGKSTTHSSELLMSEQFKHLLDSVKHQYDMVLLDTAPIFAITDPAIIGKYAGTSLLVAYYSVNTVKEIERALKHFKQNNIEITGTILNGIDEKSDDYHYVYQY
ncbi:polysaccharide biosynthesis tyrosine autokinase [Providencia sp. wls1916]|uniref:polysaccharide biosynthesis tyrosine autokinase n=1 Tax=Providencia sp. wls1916 TaxID=2675155 RepID=UPI0012B51B34|nr:polysaccharide biosynthesis tyrosine autokinase [Providencia sp. wls1916]MTC78870.1 polysaccharide biosynthesis tyrosine autokinase [Providencia sp. wls1916]